MYVKFVSDLDYSFNKETGKWDVPAVEWETSSGRYWQQFDSEDARSRALEINEAYNQRPDVKAYIEKMDETEDRWSAQAYTDELFQYALENSKTVALRDAIEFAEYTNARTKKFIAELVCVHNKLILKAKRVPAPAVNRIADFM
jgi:hypothetical protein